jgi:hypothetical protein
MKVKDLWHPYLWHPYLWVLVRDVYPPPRCAL